MVNFKVAFNEGDELSYPIPEGMEYNYNINIDGSEQIDLLKDYDFEESPLRDFFLKVMRRKDTIQSISLVDAEKGAIATMTKYTNFSYGIVPTPDQPPVYQERIGVYLANVE